ncbi:MAG: ribose transport system permease protein [Gaiellaceae bacterium]|jgi:ribose transport system permease protein|nr:ribose transport system permease protein [Gaiellaceae bacterium]
MAARVSYLSFRRISAVYVGILIVLIFSVWTPDTFLTTTTLKTLLSEQAITAMLAIGVTVPLAAAAFDLSVGFTLGLASIMVAWLVGVHGVGVPTAIAVSLLAGAAAGAANGLLINQFRIDSFIATLGMGSILQAMIRWVSGDQTIIGLDPSFERIAGGQLFGISMPVYYVLVVGALLWYVLEQTPAGRYVHATGGNTEAARLSGVPTRVVVFAALVVSGLIAAFAGVLLASSSAAGSPSVGPTYLLPAYAAVFLGSTQITPGRFNIWGTIIAVYVLATGVKGLQLVGAPFWIPDLFNGAALLLAVGLSKNEALRWSLRRRRGHVVNSPNLTSTGE